MLFSSKKNEYPVWKVHGVDLDSFNPPAGSTVRFLHIAGNVRATVRRCERLPNGDLKIYLTVDRRVNPVLVIYAEDRRHENNIGSYSYQ